MPKVIIGVEQSPRVQFTLELDATEELPDLITLPDGSQIVYSGRYLSPGDRYQYRRVRRDMIFAGKVNAWAPHTSLVG